MIPKHLRNKLEVIINFIYDRKKEFIQHFTNLNTFADICAVSVDSKRVYFVVLAEAGQRVCYDCTIEDYNKWFFSFPKEVRIDFYNKVKRKINAGIK